MIIRGGPCFLTKFPYILLGTHSKVIKPVLSITYKLLNSTTGDETNMIMTRPKIKRNNLLKINPPLVPLIFFHSISKGSSARSTIKKFSPFP